MLHVIAGATLPLMTASDTKSLIHSLGNSVHELLLINCHSGEHEGALPATHLHESGCDGQLGECIKRIESRLELTVEACAQSPCVDEDNVPRLEKRIAIVEHLHSALGSPQSKRRTIAHTA